MQCHSIYVNIHLVLLSFLIRRTLNAVTIVVFVIKFKSEKEMGQGGGRI